MQEPLTCYIKRLQIAKEFLDYCSVNKENLIQVSMALGVNLPRWGRLASVHKYEDFIEKSCGVYKVRTLYIDVVSMPA